LVIRESENVKNEIISWLIQKKALAGLRVLYLPDDLPCWRKHYICTHGWRRKSRGTGARPLQNFVANSCPFRFMAESVFRGGKWCVEICWGESLRIYDYIRNHSKYKTTTKDVDNLMSRIRGELRGEASDDVAVAEFLLAFNETDPDNVSSVDESDSGDPGAISLTTSHMHRIFNAFPELVMIDYTHKTNRFRLLIYTS
ncbi:hypothetical protein PHMEG_00033900, partial [Phytophthora megakarya]